MEAAQKIEKGTLGTSTGVSKNADNELSLIDFDGPGEANGSTSNTSGQQTGGLEDDLLGLSMGDGSFGQGGGISLGFGANTSMIFANLSRAFLIDYRSARASIDFLNKSA